MSIVSKPLLAPGFCFICKHSNDVEYWDSNRYFDAPMPLPEVGRKYVCFDCISSAAKEFGFIDKASADILKDENEALKAENKEVRLQSDLATTIITAANTLAAGQPGIAATLEPPTIQSVPDVAKVQGSEILDTLTPVTPPVIPEPDEVGNA